MYAIELTQIGKCFGLEQAIGDKTFLTKLKYLFNKPLKDLWALKNISIKIKKGECLGIIGENGSGKSTLLKTIVGILKETTGKVEVNGKIAPFLEIGVGLEPELNGKENVKLYASILGIPQKIIKENMRQIFKFAELEGFEEIKIKKYSDGMRLKLAFSTALSSNFDIFLIDEVFSVGDEFFKKRCLEKLKQLKKEGKTIVLVSHDLNLIQNFCDRVVLLTKGQIRMCGRPKGMIHEYIARSYLLKNKDVDEIKLKRVLACIRGEREGPYEMELSMTMRCNQNCVFCWRQDKKKKICKQELFLEDYKKIINESQKIGVKTIRIIGEGEPLLRDITYDVMDHIKQKDMNGFLCTNGTLFKKEAIRNLVQKEWDIINFSLKSSQEQVHDSLTNTKGAYNLLIKNVNQFNLYKTRFDSYFPILEFGVTLVNKNYKYISDIIKLANKLKVSAVNIEPLTVNSEYVKKFKLSQKQTKEFCKSIPSLVNTAQKYGIRTNLTRLDMSIIKSMNNMHKKISNTSLDKNILNASCYNPWWLITIKSNGQVGTCGFHTEYNTPTIKEGIQTIWYGDWFGKLRKKMIDHELLPQCKNCNTYYVTETLNMRSAIQKNILLKD